MVGNVSCGGVPTGNILDMLRFKTNPEPGSELVLLPLLLLELVAADEMNDAMGSSSSRSGLGTDKGANMESGMLDDASRIVAAATL